MDKAIQFDVMKDSAQEPITFGILPDMEDLPSMAQDKVDMAIHGTDLPNRLDKGETRENVGVLEYEPNSEVIDIRINY